VKTPKEALRAKQRPKTLGYSNPKGNELLEPLGGIVGPGLL